MKVGLVQHDIAWEEPERTTTHVAPMIAEAAAGGAELIVLTEMFATGFSMATDRIAEDEGGPIEQFLSAQAGLSGAHVIASISQRGPDGACRNNAVIAAPDGTVQRYAKIHPFSYSTENEHYAAGDRFLTVDLYGVRTSVFVCYDLRFADEFWALAPATDLYVVVANWPAPRHEHWRALLQARAIENQAYVVGVNRVGSAPSLDHLGGSVVIDPLGVRLVEGGPIETVLRAEVDPARVGCVRTDLPFLADRR